MFSVKNNILSLLFILGIFLICNAAEGFEEKPFVIIIPSYNNSNWYQKNLDSAVYQKYNNFRIIYIDDCSRDGTGKLVKKYIKKNKLSGKIILIKNKKRIGAMANWYHAIQSCNDNEIIVSLDGDDWLAHEYVLQKLNTIYANPNVWLTYGQHIEWPSGKMGYCEAVPQKVIQEKSFRKYKWIYAHLRSFYVWLFKQIRKEDFFYNGNFMPTTCDLAMMYPMLEMAGDRFEFIPEVLYILNRANPINDNKVNKELQWTIAQYIFKKIPYNRLDKSIIK